MPLVALGSPLRALFRLLPYFGLTLVLIPVQLFALRFSPRLRLALPQWYHRRCCRILGIHVVRRGRPSKQHPTLYLSNHISYLDITVLGALAPVSFVAKSEVRSWPFFGWLARLQRSVFVDRRSVRSAADGESIAGRLDKGDDLVLFPEGTSGDGNRVLPFKSSLLSVTERGAAHRSFVVQPVSIAYTRLDGVPLGRNLRPFYAWYGDMELTPHLWQMAGLGRVTVEVRFHPLISPSDFKSRKDLSQYCYGQVSRGVAAALSGRWNSTQA